MVLERIMLVRSTLSLPYSLNHARYAPGNEGSHSLPQIIEKDFDFNVYEEEGIGTGAGAGTQGAYGIPPLESQPWRKLSKFQRRFYKWLVSNYDLEVSESSNFGNYSEPGYLPQGRATYDSRPRQQSAIQLNRAPQYAQQAAQQVMRPDYSNLYTDRYGIDTRLVDFVSKHNVVMDDGAVVYAATDDGLTRKRAKQRKDFVPPCGCTKRQFIIAISVLAFLLLLTTVGIVLGILFGVASTPSFAMATPWWRHGLVYQINVPTFANDVEGVIGRLKDATKRMAYLSKRMSATATVLTGFLESDENGVRNWRGINPSTNSDGDPVGDLLSALQSSASDNAVHLILGAPLYATSIDHPWFAQSVNNMASVYKEFYIWRKAAPIGPTEARILSFNPIRGEYYRHVHGNPKAPLLNLADPNLQKEMQSIIAYWKETIGISGIMVSNSTNIVPELAPSLTSILESAADAESDSFVWFADNVEADSLLQNKRLCFFQLLVKRRVFTRTEDISAQLNAILSNRRASFCSPLWRIIQESEDNRDYFSLQTLASFLPGMNLIHAGEEVEIVSFFLLFELESSVFGGVKRGFCENSGRQHCPFFHSLYHPRLHRKFKLND
uniref:Trehalose-6-phosphate hydrolase n=2 Tax=Schistocephalus solidus TaxID=70667 RepID=A0A0V0J982_SCHSO